MVVRMQGWVVVGASSCRVVGCVGTIMRILRRVQGCKLCYNYYENTEKGCSQRYSSCWVVVCVVTIMRNREWFQLLLIVGCGLCWNYYEKQTGVAVGDSSCMVVGCVMGCVRTIMINRQGLYLMLVVGCGLCLNYYENTERGCSQCQQLQGCVLYWNYHENTELVFISCRVVGCVGTIESTDIASIVAKIIHPISLKL